MNKVQCDLACGHTVRYTVESARAAVGEQSYCRFDGWQEVIEVHHTEYRIVCAACTYGRWCGQNHSEAVRRATHHERLRTGHIVVVCADTVTKQGGTARNILIRDVLNKLVNADMIAKTVTKPEPPPF